MKGIVKGYLYFSPFDAFIEAYMIKKNSATLIQKNKKTAISPIVIIPILSPKVKSLKTKSWWSFHSLNGMFFNTVTIKIGMAISASTNE
jgi:hypothetical protein